MSSHGHETGPYNFVGTIIGFSAGLINADFTQGLIKTVIYSIVGAIVGFFVTRFLKKLFKVK